MDDRIITNHIFKVTQISKDFETIVRNIEHGIPTYYVFFDDGFCTKNARDMSVNEILSAVHNRNGVKGEFIVILE